MFSSASQLEKGNDVRVAGVSVGNVSWRSRSDRRGQGARFHVPGGTGPAATPPSTPAEVRYLNLVGARYLALSEGTALQGPGSPRAAPCRKTQTTPAIDLTELFNGFQPLFEVLSPERRQRAAAANLIAVFQGEGGTIKSLLPTGSAR